MNSTPRAPHADEILPATRWVLWIVVAVLLAAVALLWGFPERTDEFWAWEIQAPMTPMLLGSVYAAGAWFFAVALRGARWVPLGIGTFAAAVFAGLMLLTTLLHWDAFNLGDAPIIAAASVWAWTIVYAVSPFVVVALWLRNRRADPGVRADDVLVAPAARVLAGVASGALGVLSAGLLVRPDAFIGDWPWALTELTARVVGCLAGQLAIGMGMLARDPRWRAWEVLLRTMLVASALLLIGSLRFWDTFADDDLRAAMVLGLTAFGIAIGAFSVVMGRRAARHATVLAASA